jgi:hypothetical protein
VATYEKSGTAIVGSRADGAGEDGWKIITRRVQKPSHPLYGSGSYRENRRKAAEAYWSWHNGGREGSLIQALKRAFPDVTYENQLWRFIKHAEKAGMVPPAGGRG